MWASLQARLVALGAIVLAVLGAVAAIFQAGRRSEKDKQTRATLDAVKDQQEVRDEVERLGPDARRDELRKWSR